mgnify:CR=1 FL=1
MNYYISDLHLFHEAAIRFDDRLPGSGGNAYRDRKTVE